MLASWSAARSQHLGNTWSGSRGLAVDRERWAIPVRGEHGRVTHLPDLAVWRPGAERPAAIIAEPGGRRRDRQKAILEAWRDAIVAGQYSVVRYDCANASLAHSISRLAENVRPGRSVFVAKVQTTADEIDALPTRSNDGSAEEGQRVAARRAGLGAPASLGF
ncbi:MAG TPA: hypothetical protein VMF07_11210 [Solirubrobacteraceae bacterium]|nr:hypothetical protein [Solirubrobacteraceae bacterium]